MNKLFAMIAAFNEAFASYRIAQPDMPAPRAALQTKGVDERG